MFSAGLEPATFRVWGGRDNHYTTETTMKRLWSLKELFALYVLYASWNFSVDPYVDLISKSIL